MKKNLMKGGIVVLMAALALTALTLTGCGDGGGTTGGGTKPAITTAELPNGAAGTAYNQTLAATGDTPITWKIDSGSLPAGLSLAETTGIISGTPTTAGKSDFTVKAANSTGSATKPLSITITTSIPDSTKTLSGITVTPPTKTEYHIGDTLATAGMVVTATYSDGTTAAVAAGDYTLSSFNSSTTGNKPITVTYQGKTAVFNVNVINPSLPTVETPVASPEAGTYATAQSVTLTTATSGAAIYYTTDGSTPTKTSTLYSGAISISADATTTLQAVAVKEGMNDSDILTAVYVIRTLVSIAVTADPTKTDYTIGDTTLDTAGMVVRATYSNGTTVTIANYTLSAFDSSTAGQKTITVTYQGKTATFTVTVHPAGTTLTSIAVTTQPTKTTYTIGEALDTAGMVVTATYSDSSTQAVTGYTFSDFDSSTAGQKTVTVTYEGKTATFTVTVNAASSAKTLTSIAVTTQPTKTSYNIGDTTLDTAGMVVTATYSDGSTQAVTDYTTSVFDSSTAGQKTVTVTYEGKTATFTVTVNKTVSSIAITTQPTRTAYDIGEALSTAGMVVMATYSDSTTAAVTGYTTSGFDSATAGSKTVTVTYEGKEATFTVTVYNTTFTSISDLAAYLSAKPVNTAATAYTVKLNVSDLGGNSNTNGSVGRTLRDNDRKYVNLDLSDSTITSIGSTSDSTGVFASCSSLTSITIPNSVTTIGAYAFSQCNITSITIPNSVISINTYAFRYCTSLTSVTFEDTSKVTSVGNNAFQICTSLTSITIPDSVTSIGDQAFIQCTGLTSVTLGNSVASIGDQAFGHCTSLTAINVDSTNTTYTAENGVLYNKTKTTLIRYPAAKEGAFTIPNGVTSIEGNAFNACTKLTGITIPDSVTFISFGLSGAFRDCTGLTSMTIPFVGNTLNGTTNTHFGYIFGAANYNNQNSSIPASLKTVTITGGSIANYAFTGCANLTSVTLGNNVTGIGNQVFQTCNSLTAINVESANTAYTAEDGVLYNKAKTTLIICPIGKAGALIIPASVTSIQGSAFYNCSKLTGITIPNGVASIESSTFRYCSGLTSVTIPANVTSIDNLAFSDCDKLTSVTFGGASTTIGNDNSFPNGASLRTAYPAGGIGTYTRPDTTSTSTWTKS